MDIANYLKNSSIIPVIVLHHIDDALPLAETLIQHGINVLEITLRTPEAIPAIYKITQKFPQCIIAAGTVLEAEQFRKAKEAGAHFAVSPALTSRLAEAADEFKMPWMPGVSTCTEILKAREMGFRIQKFFPANLNGGIASLKNFLSLFPDIEFCPTGGINENNVKDYLTLSNVCCVGGSWLAQQELIEQKNWAAIGELAKIVGFIS